MAVSAIRTASVSAALLAFTLAAPTAGAEGTADYTYTLAADDTAVITAYNGSDTALTVPDVLDGHTVTKIGDNAFAYNQHITTVTLPDGVTEIGSYAFNDCTRLTTVTVPSTLAAVGEGAFFSCTSLTEVPLPNGLQSLGESAFYDCTALQSVTVPGTVTTFGSHVFADCTNLKTAALGAGLTTLPVQTFRGCIALTDVTLPDGLTEIGDRAFSDCAGLTRIDLPQSVSRIGEYAFRRTGLKSIALTKGTVGAGAFANDGMLTNVDFGAVTSIGDEAFCNTALTSVTLPATLTGLGSRVFTAQPGEDPQGILSYTVAAGSKAFRTDEQGALYTRDGTTLLAVPGLYNGAFTVPDTVTAIAPSTFAYCTELTDVTLPAALVQIGEAAFRGCSSLKSVTIPAGVKTLPAYAFGNCSSLADVTLPTGLTEVADYAFARCNALTTLDLPAALTKLTGAAFAGCRQEIHFTCAQGAALQTAADDDTMLVSADGTTLTAWMCGTDTAAVTVPDTVTALAAHSIISPSVTTVTLPAGVTEIAEEAIGYSISATTGEMTRTENFAIFAPQSAKAAYTYAKINELGCFTAEPQPNMTACTLTVGETQRFTVANSPADMTIYASSDNQVATVAQDGTITAVANGTADIFAMNGQRYSKVSVTVTGGSPAKDPYDGYRVFAGNADIKNWYPQYAAANSGFSLEQTDNPSIHNYTSQNYVYIWACQPDGVSFVPAAKAEYGDDYRQFRTVGTNLRREAARYTLNDNVVAFSGDTDLSALTSKTSSLSDILACVGKTYTPKLFTSTSLIHSVADNFATGYRRYVLEFYLPKGSQAAYIAPISAAETEKELFLNDGVNFTIVDAGIRLCNGRPECYVRLVPEGTAPTQSPTPAPTATPTVSPANTPAPTAAPTAAPTGTPAPTTAPTDTPAVVSTPVPTQTPQPTPDNSKFYTCPKCGYHNWTAVSGGYRCDHCGNIVTKQLAGYPNVKGYTEDAALTAAPAATKAPATVSDPSASIVNRTPVPTMEPTPVPTAAPTPSSAPVATPEITLAPTEAPAETTGGTVSRWLLLALGAAAAAGIGGVVLFRVVLPRRHKNTYHRR